MTPCWFLSICPATSLFMTSGPVPNHVVIIIVQPRQVHRYDLIRFNRRNSWWPDFVTWLADRGGRQKDAPVSLGGSSMPPIEPAPGSYVLEK